MVAIGQVLYLYGLSAVCTLLQGCGGGGGGPPRPTPAPTPAGWQSTALVQNKSLMLRWLYNASAKDITLNLTAQLSKDAPALGYIAIGFSADGQMHNGDYIMGYFYGDQSCVRSLTNGAAAGAIPTSANHTPLSHTAIVNHAVGASRSMSMQVTRSLVGKVPISMSGSQKVLYAAGSASVMPTTCVAPLAFSNHHDITDFVGVANVAFGASVAVPLQV